MQKKEWFNMIKYKEKVYHNHQYDRAQTILFYILLTIITGFLVWKAPYGYGGDDEAFYLTLPHRFAKGDGVLTQEWNPAQLMGVLTYPIMKIYLWITNSTEGILLAFRYIYIVVQVIITLVIYFCTKKYGFFSIVAAAMFLLFTPYNIMTLNYNSMGINCVLLFGLLIGTMDFDNISKKAIKSEKKTFLSYKIRVLLAGMMLAMGIICNPYLILLYLFLSMVMLFNSKKKNKHKIPLANGKLWLYLTGGAAIVALLLMCMIFSRSTLKDVLDNLPPMFENPELKDSTLGWIVKSYIISFWQEYSWFLFVWLGLYALAIFDKKSNARRMWYISIGSILVVSSLISNIRDIQNSYNFIMVPFTFLGLLSFLLTKEKNKPLFLYAWLGGVIYSGCLHISSNQGFYAMSFGMTVSSVTSVILIGLWSFEQSSYLNYKTKIEIRNWNKNLCVKIAALCLILTLATQLTAQVSAKAIHVFWDKPPKQLVETIDRGPKKGLKTTKKNKERYDMIYEDIKQYIQLDGGILFVAQDTWCYLLADMEYATSSAWSSFTWNQSGFSSVSKRYDRYYELHANKRPDYIYILKDNRWDEKEILDFAKKMEMTCKETDISYHLKK